MRGVASIAAMLRAKGLIALAALSAALTLSACGSSDPDPSIPRSSAETLLITLQEIQDNVDAGSCEVAASEVDELRSEIEELPSDVNEEVRQGLENGADRLELLIRDPDQCEAPEEPETTTEETTTEETTTEETTPTVETTTTTTPTETTPTVPPGGGGTGGLGPGGGGNP
jgi:hypothetical protein